MRVCTVCLYKQPGPHHYDCPSYEPGSLPEPRPCKGCGRNQETIEKEGHHQNCSEEGGVPIIGDLKINESFTMTVGPKELKAIKAGINYQKFQTEETKKDDFWYNLTIKRVK